MGEHHADNAAELAFQPWSSSAAPLEWAASPCQLGILLVAVSASGLRWVDLGDSRGELIDRLLATFGQAETLRRTSHGPAAALARDLAKDAAGKRRTLPLDVRASAFQIEVWRALVAIPAGETRSYTSLARTLARPKAQRAVANACGANPLALIIPCHRALRSDGRTGGWRWGSERKIRLLALETQGQRGTDTPAP